MRFVVFCAMLVFGSGCMNMWPKETPSNDPNTLHDLLIGVNITQDKIYNLAAEVQEQMDGLNLGEEDMTIVPYAEVRSEPYKSQYSCKGKYIGCTDVQGKVSHSLVGWDDSDPKWLYSDAITFAHELAHVWLFQITGDSDQHHKHTHIFGEDDAGHVIDSKALVYRIASAWAYQQHLAAQQQ